MKTVKTVKTVATILGGLTLTIALVWGLAANNLAMYKVFGPAMENARRETFEHSVAYTQGTIEELHSMQFEYIAASPEHQAAMASVILHKVSAYDVESLPGDLRAFVNDLKNKKTVGGLK